MFATSNWMPKCPRPWHGQSPSQVLEVRPPVTPWFFSGWLWCLEAWRPSQRRGLTTTTTLGRSYKCVWCFHWYQNCLWMFMVLELSVYQYSSVFFWLAHVHSLGSRPLSSHTSDNGSPLATKGRTSSVVRTLQRWMWRHLRNSSRPRQTFWCWDLKTSSAEGSLETRDD